MLHPNIKQSVKIKRQNYILLMSKGESLQRGMVELQHLVRFKS
jgi:hypothetical protein